MTNGEQQRRGGTPDDTGNGPAGTLTRALVLHPVLRGEEGAVRGADARLEEAVGLARAIDLDIVAAESQRLDRPRAGSLLGRGSIERLAELVADREVEVAVVDATLSPVQQRNLERALNCKVIDRTGLILEIFGERARTKEGQLQVDLAALSYQRSRLVRSWTHLERQRGGAGFMGGPGERQIELDRRLLSERIVRLRRELDQVKRTRELHRQARRRVPYPVVALVGYTNAGKSTLFNRLTASDVMAEDLLFATLDPTMRRLRLPSGQMIILSDTVGFITDLPTDLIAAFRATLEEVTSADLVVHVRDIAHPESEAQKQGVDAVLRDLGIDTERREEGAILEVMNKIDLLDGEARALLSSQLERHPNALAMSAATGEGTATLLAEIETRLQASHRVVSLSVDLTDGATLAWLYRHGEVLGCRDDERAVHLQVSLDPISLARFEQRQATATRPGKGGTQASG